MSSFIILHQYPFDVKTQKVLLSIRNNDEFIGILCKGKDLINQNGLISFSESAINVPVYRFPYKKVLSFNDRMFYKYIYAGKPEFVQKIKLPMEIVKEIVINSISWSNYRNKNFVRADYRAFKEFIKALPMTDIISIIAEKCNCSLNTANDLLSEFISKVTDYIEDWNIDTEVLMSAINSNSDLMQKTKELVKEDWEKEYSEKIKKPHPP